jgi:hypothetical protein
MLSVAKASAAIVMLWFLREYKVGEVFKHPLVLSVR